MNHSGTDQREGAHVETVLREELARGDTLLEAAGPVLRHLLANDDTSLFGDEIIARVRGMLCHLAEQLLMEQALAAAHPEPADFAAGRSDGLVGLLIGHSALVAHVHATALEGQLTDRLQARAGIDAVLSPLLQALISSGDADTAGAGMAMLAAQARFVQQQRRMELPLCELPGDLFHVALIALRTSGHGEEDAACAAAETTLRARFDEGRSRLGLASRLVTAMGGGAVAALSLSHAGVALFLTALGMASVQSRSSAVMATDERQLARLALSLRAAGLKTRAVEEQFVILHPDFLLPEGFDAMRADRAATLLSMAPPALGN